MKSRRTTPCPIDIGVNTLAVQRGEPVSRRSALIVLVAVTAALLVATGSPSSATTPPHLVKDINTKPVPGTGGPDSAVRFAGALWFSGDDGVHGRELWRSDGTPDGTSMLADVWPGPSGSWPGTVGQFPGTAMLASGPFLYFGADDGVHGVELWRTDGTPDGTSLVKDLIPGVDSSRPQELTNVGGRLFFVTLNVGMERLWTSDGTEAGTIMLRTFFSGEDNHIGPFFGLGSTLYFGGVDGLHGLELWRSDGTKAGTVRFKDLVPGEDSSVPAGFVNLKGTLFFRTSPDVENGTLWKSDGTRAGTVQVRAPGPAVGEIAVAGGRVLFAGIMGGKGLELWRSDGTAAGTVLVKDIRPGAGSSFPYELTRMGSELYFTADDGTHGRELWRSDGTAAGTALTTTVVSTMTLTGTLDSSPFFTTDFGGSAVFSADDGVSGREPWISDGTGAGTHVLHEIGSGSAGSSPTQFTEVGSRLFFANGAQLWVTDGTDERTNLVKSIGGGVPISEPVEMGEALVFAAHYSNNPSDVGLWRSDGTSQGTTPIADINFGGLSFPQSLTVAGSTLYFSANGAGGRELWKSNGDVFDAARVEDINLSGSSNPRKLAAVGSTLFFTAVDGIHGEELWKTDGSPEGTTMVADIAPDSAGSSCADERPAALGTLLLFSADDGNGCRLWVSDAEGSGAQAIGPAGSEAGSFPRSLTVFGDTVLFAGSGGAGGTQLWSMDGTDDGTGEVAGVQVRGTGR